ncbi:MAG: molybdate ABC transporter substrate-binding protein [Burkholderiales bacterium]|nr:molybdate ABC transporter substrate-binding protein [Burkholderiales bacterium]
MRVSSYLKEYDVHLLATFALTLALAAPTAAQEIVVSAAASLTNAFRDIGKDFEARNAGVKVTFNFAASDVLVTQIVKGAPADVFASADQAAMDRGEAAGAILAGTRRDFAANALVLVVPGRGPAPAALAELTQERYRRIALGSPQSVPAGRYAKEALDAAKLWGSLESRLVFAQNVRQVLDYVARGEADAGFVYATDAAIMPDKVKVVFDVPTSTPVRYPIAAVKDSKHPALAKAFVALVASDAGQAELRKYGFRAP